MNKDTVKEIVYIMIAVILSVIAVKFVIWLLPFILIAILSYLIYNSIKRNKEKTNNKSIKEIHDFNDEK